jgi:hypothetical protein
MTAGSCVRQRVRLVGREAGQERTVANLPLSGQPGRVSFPCGCGWFVAGFRAEWGYVWSDILQRQNNSDLILINLLGSIGYRF